MPLALAAAIFGRLVLATHDCCAAGPDIALLLLIPAELLWSYWLFKACTDFLDATDNARHHEREPPSAAAWLRCGVLAWVGCLGDRARRWALASALNALLLGVSVAALGAEAIWALGSYAPNAGMRILLHVCAVAWAGFCVMRVIRK